MIRAMGIAVTIIGAGVAIIPPRLALAPAPRCRIEIRNSDREFTRQEMFNNATNVNVDIAGNVRLKCVNQEVYLNADSSSSISGDYVRLYGHVVYRDSSYRFNADTMKQKGLVIPVIVTVYKDKSFDLLYKTPPASILLCKAAGIEKGSGEPNKNKVGKVTRAQIAEIAKVKVKDLNASTPEAAARIIEGTARSMGLEVIG